MSRRATLAFLLSFLCPGTGQLLAGRRARAITVAIVTPLVLFPSALWLWSQSVGRGGALLSFAATAFLSLPALDAAWLVSRARHDTARGAGLLSWIVVPAVFFPLLFVTLAGVTSYWLAPVRLDRESGRPNLLPGDVFLLDRREAAVASLAPGDLVVFEHPPRSGRLHVKRWVAAAGQRVEVRGGALRIDGEPRAIGVAEGDATASDREQIGERRYRVERGDDDEAAYGPLLVPQGTLFALGDDRSISRDSRAFGPVSLTLLRGRPLRIVFSRDPATGDARWDRIGLDPNRPASP